MSVKDKLDSASQADWTETDSTDPSFIKHKIPIWITQGSADDNMSPIDSVTDGSMRPVTSNAVADAISGLDVASVGGSGKYIQSISEVDGKIVAVEQNIANTVTVDNMQSVTSGAVYNELLNYALKNRVMPLVKSVIRNDSASLSIADLPFERVYLVIATDLYYSWQEYNIGILLNYNSTNRSYVNIAHNNLNITIDGSYIKTITSNRHIWGAKFYEVGYY